MSLAFESDSFSTTAAGMRTRHSTAPSSSGQAVAGPAENVITLFESLALRQTSAAAIRDNESIWSHRELNQRVDVLARGLVSEPNIGTGRRQRQSISGHGAPGPGAYVPNLCRFSRRQYLPAGWK